MSSLPSRDNIAGTPTNAVAKAALAAIYDFVAQRLARGTTGAGSATATELASARDSLGVPQVNWVLNPDGAIYQRSVAATADDTYFEDRWYALTQSGTVTPSQQSNPENGFRYASRLTQSQASAQRMGAAQIVEGKDAIPLRGKTVTFGGRFKLSTSANLRVALLAWTGTEDSVTSDVVNDWTNGTFTTGNFFISSNLTLIGTAAVGMTGGSAADVSVSGAVPSGTTNLLVVYWTEATAAQNVTLDAWGRRLIESSYLNDHIRRSIAQELALCQRFYEATTMQGELGAVGSTYAYIQSWQFKVQKRTSPTVTTNVTSSSGASSFSTGYSNADSAGLRVISNITGNVLWTWSPSAVAEL